MKCLFTLQCEQLTAVTQTQTQQQPCNCHWACMCAYLFYCMRLYQLVSVIMAYTMEINFHCCIVTFTIYMCCVVARITAIVATIKRNAPKSTT